MRSAALSSTNATSARSPPSSSGTSTAIAPPLTSTESSPNGLVATYARLGLAATTRGPLDEVRGAPFRQLLLGRHHVPSVDDGAGVVFDRGGVRVLVVGVDAGTDPTRVSATIAAHAGDSPAVDLVVVLAQLTHAQAKAQAARWPGVDVVVVGKAPEVPIAPERVGDAVVVSAGWQAQQAGVVVVHLDDRAPGAALALDDRAAIAASRKAVLDVRLTQLDESLAALPPGPQRAFQEQRRAHFAAERAALDDVAAAPPLSGPHVVVHALPLRRGDAEEPLAARDLQGYLRSIPTLVAACERDVACPEPPADVARYVGGETCRACHAGAFEHWQRAVVTLPTTDGAGVQRTRPVGHAIAWETLVHAGRERDRTCVGCHSAGFGKEGGACTTTQLVERGLTGVQCESCHGPGSLHVQAGGDKAKIRRDVDEATCRGCHVPPHIESVASFDFTERLRVILGPGHGAARWQVLQAQPQQTSSTTTPR
jgi:hypothetical protein